MVVLTEKHLYTDVSGNDMCIQGNTPYWLDRVHKTGEGATTYIDTQCIDTTQNDGGKNMVVLLQH